MCEEQFLLEMSQRCFRLARSCSDVAMLGEISQIGQALLSRAQSDSALSNAQSVFETPTANVVEI